MFLWADLLSESPGKRQDPKGQVLPSGKELACQCRRHKRCRFDPWVRKIPWRKKWQCIPVFLPGESPRTEEPSGLQSIRSQRIGHNGSDWASARKSQVHPQCPAQSPAQSKLPGAKPMLLRWSPQLALDQTLCLLTPDPALQRRWGKFTQRKKWVYRHKLTVTEGEI